MSKRGVTAGNRGLGSKWIRKAKRLRIYARDGWCCVWCRAAVRTANDPERVRLHRALATLDHFLPRSRGGGNEASNLVTACARCNEERGEMPALNWAAQLQEETHVVLERVLQALEAPLPKREEERAA